VVVLDGINWGKWGFEWGRDITTTYHRGISHITGVGLGFSGSQGFTCDVMIFGKINILFGWVISIL